MQLKPFLKWPGGKTQLLDELFTRFPKSGHINDYYEPFVGGGSVLARYIKTYCYDEPQIYISDNNPELIRAYNVIMNDAKGLSSVLADMVAQYRLRGAEYYYTIRAWDRRAYYDTIQDIAKVARTIFLNKTCYNGLYRVNQKGQFNVPYGDYKNPTIYDSENLIAWHTALNLYLHEPPALLHFKEALSRPQYRDFVYLDPPYDESFTGYTKEGFTKEDQKELYNSCKALSERGVLWMQSNHATGFILDLYKDYNITIVDAKRSINSNGAGRGKVEEVIIRNYT